MQTAVSQIYFIFFPSYSDDEYEDMDEEMEDDFAPSSSYRPRGQAGPITNRLRRAKSAGNLNLSQMPDPRQMFAAAMKIKSRRMPSDITHRYDF